MTVAVKKDRGMETMLQPGNKFAVSMVPEAQEKAVMKVGRGWGGWGVTHTQRTSTTLHIPPHVCHMPCAPVCAQCADLCWASYAAPICNLEHVQYVGPHMFHLKLCKSLTGRCPV